MTSTTSTTPTSQTSRTGVQGTFADLGTPLVDVTFVVVDLETTGGSAAAENITEIGAVKVRGGEVLGEFQTLVRPKGSIPAHIRVLTGITDAMVVDAPSIEEVMPSFLEFLGSAVLVAHNAPYDVGFLRAACTALERPWPRPVVVDTVHLARQLVTRDETPNHKLSSLARLFGTATAPDHRALHDARATVDVLHALLGRVGNLGVHSLEELRDYSARVTPAQRRKRTLADDLPAAPGVYVFKDARGEVLYVGTSVDIRKRVRSYFTRSEQRSRMREMVGLAESVTPVVCATTLEAQVRELRLIAEHKPRFNRRSRHPERAAWVRLTDEPFPRLSVVREVRTDDHAHIGPFPSRTAATLAVEALQEAVPIRRCTRRLPLTPGTTACALYDLGKCGAPCIGAQGVDDYATVVADAGALMRTRTTPLTTTLGARMERLSAQERFEEAAAVRDRLGAFLKGTAKAQRHAPLARSTEVVAARRSAHGGWEVVCIRHGRLAGVVVTPRGVDPMGPIESMIATAEVVAPPVPPRTAALPEETDLVLRWLEQPDVRLVRSDAEWTCPVDGAERARLAFEATLEEGSHSKVAV